MRHGKKATAKIKRDSARAAELNTILAEADRTGSAANRAPKGGGKSNIALVGADAGLTKKERALVNKSRRE